MGENLPTVYGTLGSTAGTETAWPSVLQLPAVTQHPLASPPPAQASQAAPTRNLSPHSHPGACSSCFSFSLACCVRPSLEHSPSLSHSVAQVGFQLLSLSLQNAGVAGLLSPGPGPIFCMVYLNTCSAFSLPITMQPPGPAGSACEV